jgi:hypothetical protein
VGGYGTQRSSPSDGAYCLYKAGDKTNQFDETGVGVCAKIRELRYAKLKVIY